MGGRTVVTPGFEILRNGGVLKLVPIKKAKLVVGSAPGVDLRIKHPKIAGEHLIVEVVEGKYLRARNLAGAGRLAMGGRPVEEVRLREGDELDLGPVALRLTYDRGEGSEAVPQARRAKPVPVPEEEAPTDADRPAPFRSPTRESAPGSPEEESRFTEVATQTMRVLDKEPDDAPTQTMPAGRRPTAVAPPPPAPTPLPALRPEPAATEPTPPPPTRSAPSYQRPSPPPSSLRTDPELEAIILDPIPVLTLSPGPGLVRRVPLRVGQFDMGTASSNFELPHEGVAAKHALLYVMPDGAVYLRHIAGQFGRTLLNGAPLRFARVHPGDQIQLGSLTCDLSLTPLSELATSLRQPPPAPAEREVPSSGRLEAVPPKPLDEDSGIGVAPPFGARFPHERVADTEEPTEPPTPAPRPTPARAPVAARAPLVKVKRKSTPGQPAPTAPAPYLVDDDIEYRKPLAQRMIVPAVIAALLAIIAYQFWSYRQVDEGPASSGPRRASGSAPYVGGDVETPGGGPVVVGDPRRGGGGAGASGGPREPEYLGNGGAGGYGGAMGYVDPANDWDPGVDSRTYRTHGEGSGGERATAERVDSGAAAAEVDRQDFLAEKAAAQAREEQKAKDAGRPTGQKGGWVEMADVEAVIYQDRKKLRYCYSTARESDPGLSGVMWLTLTLATDGRIRQANLESRSTVKDDALFKCLRRQLSTMPMPVPDGGNVTFSYPFELTQ